MTRSEDENTMLYHVGIAMLRKDWTERVVLLAPALEDAQRLGQRVTATMSAKFVRCRIRQMDLTAAQIRAICHEWGRLDALEGEPMHPTDFPRPYAAAYRRGYRAGKKFAPPGGKT